ncbi:MAG: hypothetical protein Q8R29_00550, partial [bacterium]|nr:hypothetical protein [bacterium]
MFTNHRIQKYIATLTLASFSLFNFSIPLTALAQVGGIKVDLSRDVSAQRESQLRGQVDVSRTLTPVTAPDGSLITDAFRGANQKPDAAIGEILGTLQKGDDVCKDISGSIGQVAMQLGIKMAKDALKKIGKKLAIATGKAIGEGAVKALDAFIPGAGTAAKNFFKSVFGKKSVQDVAIKKGGALEDFQKKFFNKECLLKPFVRATSAMMIRSLTTSIVTWIQGYDPVTNRSNVGFVGNFKQSLRQELDQEAGIFLNKLTNVNLCGGVGFQRFLKIRLSTPYGYPDDSSALQRQLGCTATDIVKQVKYDYRALQENFAGGWPAFLRFALEPQNNPYGAYLIALDAKVLAETEAREGFEKGFLAGGGFLGFTTDEYRDCLPIRDQATINHLRELKTDSRQTGLEKETKEAFKEIYDDFKRENAIKEKGTGWEQCSIDKVVRTPGQTTAFMLNKVIGSGIDQATVATEMDNLISATINATINRIVGGSGGRSKGIFQSELASAIDKEATKTGDEFTNPLNPPSPILELIAKANLAMAYLDKNILIPALNNMASNLSSVGSEQSFPGQIPGEELRAPSLTYQGIVGQLREGALELSRESHVVSQVDFATFRDGFKQKQQIQTIRIQLMEKLLNLIKDEEDLQGSTASIGLATLRSSLNSATLGLPLPEITLYGFVENNLNDFSTTIYESANDAGRKIAGLNNLNLNSLPGVSGNYQTQGLIDASAFTLNNHKIFLDNNSAIFDPANNKEKYLDEWVSFLADPTTQNSIREIMARTLTIDEIIFKMLGSALAIPQNELNATTT